MKNSSQFIRAEIRSYLIMGYSVYDLEKLLPHVSSADIMSAAGNFGDKIVRLP
jgi:hypothetical protein